MILRMTVTMLALTLAGLVIFEVSGVDIDWAVALTGLGSLGLLGGVGALWGTLRSTSHDLEALPF